MTEVSEFTANIIAVETANSKAGAVVLVRFRSSAPFSQRTNELECSFVATSLDTETIRRTAARAISAKMRELYEEHFRAHVLLAAKEALLNQSINYSFRTAE